MDIQQGSIETVRVSVMKKVLLLPVLFFIALTCYSQKYYSADPTSSILFNVGISSSAFVNDTAKFARLVGYTGGLMYSKAISEKFNVYLAGMYSLKGYKRESPVEKHRHYFLDIPLYFQFKPSPDIRFDLGAQYSLFSFSTVTILDGAKSNGFNTIRNNKKLGSSPYSGLAGIDIRLHDNFDMAARYTFSLSKKADGMFSIFELQLHYYMIQFYNKGKVKEEK
jgi:hypothetical protein